MLDSDVPWDPSAGDDETLECSSGLEGVQCGMALFLSRVSTPFEYLSRVLLPFMVMARRAKKNFWTVQGFPKGQARVSKQ